MNPSYPFYVPEETDHKDSPPPYESCEPGMEMRDSAPFLFQYVWTRYAHPDGDQITHRSKDYQMSTAMMLSLPLWE